MKRIVVLLTVVALMVGMLAMSVTPAFAKYGLTQCTNPTTQDQVVIYAKDKKVWKAWGYTECHPA